MRPRRRFPSKSKLWMSIPTWWRDDCSPEEDYVPKPFPGRLKLNDRQFDHGLTERMRWRHIDRPGAQARRARPEQPEPPKALARLRKRIDKARTPPRYFREDHSGFGTYRRGCIWQWETTRPPISAAVHTLTAMGYEPFPF